MRYVMSQKVLAFKDDFTIVDDSGQAIYRILGKTFSVGDKLSFSDMEGNELATIKQRVVAMVPNYRISRDGKLVAVVKQRALSLLKDKFKVDMRDGAADMQVVGNMTDHEYTFMRGEEKVASITRKWVSMGDTYGIEIAPGQDDLVILACVVVIDMINHDTDKDILRRAR